MYLYANQPGCSIKPGDWICMPQIGEGRVHEVTHDFNDDGKRCILSMVIHLLNGKWMVIDLTTHGLTYTQITCH